MSKLLLAAILKNVCRFGPISIPMHGKEAGEAEMMGAQAALILRR